MKIRCADVVVQKRVRKDLGELDGLMESIRLLGLLQPIGITKQNVLVFGQRRLIACQMLGHEEIEAKVVDVPSIVDGEYAENEIRKDFTVSERVAIAKELEDGIGERRGGLRVKGVKPQNFGKREDQVSGKETRSIAGCVAGFGNHETYRQAKIVVSKGAPDLVEKVDSGKVSINAAYKEIQREEKKREREQQIREAASTHDMKSLASLLRSLKSSRSRQSTTNLRKEGPTIMRKSKSTNKLCPLLDQECQRQGCMIYNEKFERCDIGLLAYNAYLLSAAIKQLNGNRELK